MCRVLKIMLAMLLGAAGARASPWWVSWNGDAYPETEGWTRYASDPPAQRWLEDGKLFIDSRADWFIYEEYGQFRPGQMTLGPQETLVVHWRVKVDEIVPTGSEAPGLAVSSDDQWDVFFTLGVDRISSVYEPGKWASFAPGVFHEFSLHSSDLRTYTLWIDGTPTIQGSFFESLFYGPGVYWGDMTSHRSLAEWDWFECAVTPEPSVLLCLAAVLSVCRPFRKSARR